MKPFSIFAAVTLALVAVLWTGIALAETAIADEGDFVLIMEDPETEENQAVLDFLTEQGRFEDLIELLNQIALPTDITVMFYNGDPEDAYYDPEEQTIVMSYEFADLVYAVFSESPYEYYDDEEVALAATLHTLEDTLFHEAGHALIDVLEIPITGREEDSVDALSAYMLSFILEEPEIIVSAADFYDIISYSDEEITNEEMWDEHALDEQRYYNLICWCYGSNPAELEYLLEESGLGDDRAARCEDEYNQIVRSWSVLLEPYIME